MLYSINYDLKNPGKNYEDLYKALKKFGTRCHPCESLWFIVTDMTASDLRDTLVAYMDKNDVLIVAQAKAPGAWKGLSQETTDWLKKYL